MDQTFDHPPSLVDLVPIKPTHTTLMAMALSFTTTDRRGRIGVPLGLTRLQSMDHQRPASVDTIACAPQER